MVHRRGKMPKTRTRTVTKTKFRTRFMGRVRSASKHRALGHVPLILAGIGSGATVSTGTQMISKYTGFRYPVWLNPVISGVVGLLVGKSITHSWGKAAEVAVVAAGTAFAEDHIISVGAVPRGNVSGGAIQVF